MLFSVAGCVSPIAHVTTSLLQGCTWRNIAPGLEVLVKACPLPLLIVIYVIHKSLKIEQYL